MRLPQTVGNYRLVERLGGGAFGTVYRAEVRGELGYSQDVALKVLDPGRAGEDPELVASLADEAKILSRIHHPSIVHVRRLVSLSHDALGETLALEMEFVRGVSLGDLIDLAPEISISAVVAIITEMLEALEYAHGARDESGELLNLVHRDLKPENVLVTTEGRLKLLDFGIARATNRLARETAIGETKGTPMHMSPEQLRGEHLDGRSDLYAVGLLAYELITRVPYVDVSDIPVGDVHGVLIRASQTRFHEREEELQESLDGRDALPSEADLLVDLLRFLLEHSPADRPADAGIALEQCVSLPLSRGGPAARRELASIVAEVRRGLEEVKRTRDAAKATRVVPSSDRLEVTPPEDRSDWLVASEKLEAPTQVVDQSTLWLRGAALAGLGLVLIGLGVLLTRTFGDDEAGGVTAEYGTPVPEATPGVVPETTPAEELMAEATPDAVPETTSTEEPVAEATPGAVPETTPTEERAPDPDSTPGTVAKATPKQKPGPAPPSQEPPVIRHLPPKVAVAGAKLNFAATLAGAVGDCKPTVWIAPKTGDFRAIVMVDGGGRWTATPSLPFDEAHAEGVRYYIECCTAPGECPARWKSAGDPAFVPAPAF